MPFYDFKCKKCEHVFDDMVKFDDPNPVCVKCSAETERLIGGSNFQLKGNGWYKTDFSGKEIQKDPILYTRPPE